MSAWSEFCKKYALENGITYTAASKLPEVKELYKAQKTEFIAENDMIFQEKLEAAIEKFEAEALEEILEPLVFEELPEDASVTVTIDLPVAPPQTPKIFIAKPKKIKTIGLKRV